MGYVFCGNTKGKELKKISLISLFLLLPFSVFADEVATDTATDTPATLDLAIRRIGLEWSKTELKNESHYQDSPVSALNADSQDFIKGVFDTALEYKHDRFQWNNSLFMEYGETKLKPYDEPATVSENADDILFSSNLDYACWNFSGIKFGPTIRGAYDTEFVARDNTPRQNIARANAGLALFDNKVIKSLYLTGVYEYDFTYAGAQTAKLASELGWRLEYEVRKGVKFSSNGYYRKYLSYSDYVATDLTYDFSAIVRMDTNLWGDLTMGPYAQYRRAHARGADVYGSNFVMGISFNYITKFGLK